MAADARGAAAVPTLLLSGSAGAGKSIVAKEVHELLRRAQRRNVMIDLDAVGRVWPIADEPFNSGLVVDNLAAMWPNYDRLDPEFVVLARVLLSADELRAYRTALPRLDIRVARLEVPDAQLRARLHAREPGVSQDFLVRTAPDLAAQLRDDDLAEIVVDNANDRTVTAVALELLDRLGWLQQPSP
jgi:predicted kinase